MSKFTPTAAELALVSQIFNQADPQKLGILTGDVAVKVFGGAKLPPTVLGEIWSIADDDNNGWLPRKGVAIALRLIGWAQKGEKITQELVNRPGPLATIEGFTVVAQNNTGTPLAKSPPPTLPPLTPQEKAKFQNLFNQAGPDANGLLSGSKARDIFLKSKLSNDTLLQIWNLADTQDRGALDPTDFAIGMYFIQGLMSEQITFVPATLPPGLYQQAGGNPSSHQDSVRSHMSGSSGSFSPLSAAFPQTRSAIQPQYTGQSQLLQPDHTGYTATSSGPPVLPARRAVSAATAPPFVPQRNGHVPQWDVTPAEKANVDKYFDELDPQRRGYIEGDVAVPFMLKSNLPSDDLARVWDLADINNDGKLTRDGFAVAMHLIQKRIAGIEIPSVLPASLVPPSMRSISVSSPFSSAPQRQPQQEVARDLLWDDTPPASASTPQPPVHPSEPARSVPPAASPSRDPFGSSGLVSSQTHHDLLGDDEDVGHTSPPLHDQSAEIGNTQNQLNSTNRALDTLKNERAQVEDSLANQTSQLNALQTQLASAKASYETETKLLATFRERYSTQTTELQKAREELIRAESDLSAVRVEKAEIEGAFLRDKEEVRELHRKMVEVGQLVEATKAEVEKAKKDAKQQKGLLAIAKKQLSSKEAEKAKVEKELEEASAEVAAITKERTDAESELAARSGTHVPARADSVTFAAAQPLPASPDPSSPSSIATGKSNNPFDKLTKSTGTPRSQSPFLPFAGTSLPSPGVNDAPAADGANRAPSFDPFGFSDAFGTEEPPSDTSKALDTTNAIFTTPAPGDIVVPDAHSVLSPGTEGGSEHFVTPPTTATMQPPETSSPAPPNHDTSPAAKFPALDDAASKFPDLGVESSNETVSSVPRAETERETDLGSSLKELEVDDSDSDSEDEVPLADLAAKTRTPQEESAVAPTQVAPTESGAPSFDDVFGITSPTVAASAPIQFSSATADKPVASTPDAAKSDTPAVAGVSAFDEAMGTIPSSSSQQAQAFTFESVFEDNFDFDSATSNPFPPPPTTNVPNRTKNNNEAFDSIFTTPTKNDTVAFPPLPSAANGQAVESSTLATTKPTFDNAFSGFGSGPSLNLDSSFGSPTLKAAAPTPNVPPAQPVVPSSPTNALSSPPRTVSSRPMSPTIRSKSPPPRASSPKSARPSTSSSKEAKDMHEKLKEPPTRHSKLSIRLPFGKKKKQQQQPAEALPPTPSQHLEPPREEPARTVSPAVDDDVEAVKQLSAMGFSRTEAPLHHCLVTVAYQEGFLSMCTEGATAIYCADPLPRRRRRTPAHICYAVGDTHNRVARGDAASDEHRHENLIVVQDSLYDLEASLEGMGILQKPGGNRR
ncbi:putative eps15 homology domain containing protein [Lyophyllum shimeji]|uniref:Eps15 homology domain containing protein n=1 Tax=Lyophyllum shimeji TaxID=47721 RepID=A0A9P3PGS3_LYOSH|nr:putative eps15 homology domain containing protein [Lyophyllum shimeji]